MAPSKKEVAPRQPSELNVLKTIVVEFINRFETIESELDLLKEDQKALVEEFSDRLDVKTLRLAIRTIKIKKKVDHLDTYEQFVHILDERETL
jgi:uncharacterized protein (UPF0335 family)